MPDTYAVDLRTVTGKKVARLRREGLLPANIYGRGLPSLAVQLPYAQARDLMNAHGRNTLVQVQVAGERESRPVVVRQVGQNPVTRALLHLDFYQVNLTRLMQAQIPVMLIGEAPAVARWSGVLVQLLDHVEVEALPQNLPEHLEVSVSGLTELEQHVLLSEVSPPPGVRVITDPESIVASIQRPRLAVEEESAVPEGEQPAAGTVAASE